MRGVQHACPLLAATLLALPASGVAAQCPPGVSLPSAGAPLASPLFPADHWWNTDVSKAPIDRDSARFIAFIGASRRLHPDFGGEAHPGSTEIYGMPYVVVGPDTPKVTVAFEYADESDGTGVPFYPVPAQAQTQRHWIEGGAAGNVDARGGNDRHLLLVDCARNHLYELYDVWFDASRNQWYAGSGAFFDLARNDRRPEGWTSADAAGLAILPGLVRYDEAWNPAIPEIRHAFRVTVRATDGYVYPASHRAGGTAGALPMGARLRLRTNVNGQDPALRTADPSVRKIFRAMQRYGLIVADNGTDMYVTGTFDTRWDNDILNPAFALLTAGDFDVVELGWKPPAAPPTLLAALRLLPAQVIGGSSTLVRVSLHAPAPAGGLAIALMSSDPTLVRVPAQVVVPAGALHAHAMVTTRPRRADAIATLTARVANETRDATLAVTLRRGLP